MKFGFYIMFLFFFLSSYAFAGIGVGESAEQATPVELSYFNVSLGENNSVELHWQTATEVNNYGFDVQRTALDNQSIEWETVGFVEGSGNSNSPKTYSFTDNVSASGKFSYRLKQIDFDGSVKYSQTIEIDINTPTKFELMQNYPNPFNPTTTITYSLPVTRGVETQYTVSLQIFNSLGQKVATLVNKEQAPGNYSVQFSADNLPSGIYFYKLTAGKLSVVKKMLLLR